MFQRKSLNLTVTIILIVAVPLITSILSNWSATNGVQYVLVAYASVRCYAPGIVDNNTSKNMLIQYDDNSGAVQNRVLVPGQSSTSYICDTDRFTMTGTSGIFWIGSITYPNAYIWNAGTYWPGSSGSIANQHWKCSDRQGAGTLNVSCVTVY